MNKKLLLLLIALITISLLVFSACNAPDNDDGGNQTQTNGGTGTGGGTTQGSDNNGTGLEFELSDDETYYSVVGIGTCTDTELVIPNEYNGKPVTSIGDFAFKNTGITSVTIPNSVTSIGEDAFKICRGLTNITIPNSVTSIGEYAFSGCVGLTSVTIGDSVTSIGDRAFGSCNTLVEVINNSNITITAGSSSNGYVGYYALVVHNDDTSRIVDKDGYLFYTHNGVNYLLGYKGNNTALTLPTNYDGESYQIYEYAFEDCTGLTSVTIPNSVTSIGAHAFEYCTGLTSVTIPNSITSIGERVFGGCEGLTGITIPDSVTSIGYAAFQSCEGVTSVTIPDSVTSISDYAFSHCYGLTTITLPNSVTSIGEEAFNYCPIETATIPCIAIEYILRSNLKTVIINGGTGIGREAFENCRRLTSITIPDSVTSIGYDAFRNCTGLTSVTIPNSVTSIGDRAFESCDKLVEVINKSNLTITVGSSSYGEIGYYALVVHNDDTSHIVDKDGYLFYTHNGVHYLLGYNGIDNTLTLPANYNGENYQIYNSAFSGCKELTSITIPNSVTSIGSQAFEDCTGLTSVTIPNSVTSIGDYVFQECTKLTSIKYRGTEEQWKAILKGYGWNYETGNYTITYNYTGE